MSPARTPGCARSWIIATGTRGERACAGYRLAAAAGRVTRERVLGVYHWSAEEFGFNGLHYSIQTPKPIEIDCRAAQPARAVDYRIYLPRLMEDFVDGAAGWRAVRST